MSEFNRARLTIREVLLTLHQKLRDHELPFGEEGDTQFSAAKLSQGLDVLCQAAHEAGDRAVAKALDDLTYAATAAANKDEWRPELPTAEAITAAVMDRSTPKAELRDVLVFLRNALLRVTEQPERGIDSYDLAQAMDLILYAANLHGDIGVKRVIELMSRAIEDPLSGVVKAALVPTVEDIDGVI